jgi:catalase
MRTDIDTSKVRVWTAGSNAYGWTSYLGTRPAERVVISRSRFRLLASRSRISQLAFLNPRNYSPASRRHSFSSGPGVPYPTPVDAYFAAHPVAKTFLETQQPPPVSYGSVTYYGVNTFKFTHAQGSVRYGRYRIIPEAGNHFWSADLIHSVAPGYLADEIRRRVAHGPIRFHMLVQLAQAGDQLDDPSIAWPETRKTIDVGLIEITSAVSDSDAAERQLIFLPAALPAGIEPADPMIEARSEAYPVSYARRYQ